MYFSSVLDLCTLNLVNHAFSHHSCCNSQLDCLFARAAFHRPISSKHFTHCGVCTYRTQFVANFAFRSICRTSQLFFPAHLPHFLCMVTTLLHCYSFYMRFPLYIYNLCVKLFLVVILNKRFGDKCCWRQPFSPTLKRCLCCLSLG